MTPEPELREVAKDIGRKIGANLPEGVGFALLVFDFDGPGSLAWISNANRDDMLKALKEFMQKAAH